MSSDPTAPEFYEHEYWLGHGDAHSGGYRGCPAWGGWRDICHALTEVLSLPSRFRLLDAGAGTGAAIKEAHSLGIDAWGIDFAPWPVNHPSPGVPPGRLSVYDLRNPIEGHYDLCLCCSVLEHVRYDYFETVLANLANCCTWLAIKVDTLDVSWPEAASVSQKAFSYTYHPENNPPRTDLQKALVRSGHATTLPMSQWHAELAKHLPMTRRQDIEDSAWLRLHGKIDWDNLLIFGPNAWSSRRNLMWLFGDYATDFDGGPITADMVWHRVDRGDLVGSCSGRLIRDQWQMWRERIGRTPDFCMKREGADVVYVRHPWTTDFVFVERDRDEPLMPRSRRVTPDEFVKLTEVMS